MGVFLEGIDMAKGTCRKGYALPATATGNGQSKEKRATHGRAHSAISNSRQLL